MSKLIIARLFNLTLEQWCQMWATG